jgi:hypothetical protein
MISAADDDRQARGRHVQSPPAPARAPKSYPPALGGQHETRGADPSAREKQRTRRAGPVGQPNGGELVARS